MNLLITQVLATLFNTSSLLDPVPPICLRLRLRCGW